MNTQISGWRIEIQLSCVSRAAFVMNFSAFAGVSILRMMPTPFPYIWHRETDNKSCLHYLTINNINTILRIFVSEYLHSQI